MMALEVSAAIALLLAAPAADPVPHAPGEATAQGGAGEPAGPEAGRRWSSFLPLLAEEARKRGIELPLPFGASLVYTHLERDIRINDVRIGQGGSPPTSVSQLAQFSSRSRVSNLNLKVDAWLLPFLNLYGLLGWFENSSTTRVQVAIPRPGGLPPVQRSLELPTTLEGSIAGLGATLAGGYPPFFLVVDANAFGADFGFSDALRGAVVSARGGYAGSPGGVPFNAWLSATYWNTTTTVVDRVSDPTLGEVAFEADQGPAWKWTYGIGANARFHPHFELFAEIGTDLHGGWYLVLGPTGRL